ncbi:cytochrome-c peroxidase [Marinomonas ostreistagni]|uniref:cytochrome-c peroxidase n=1 Tax=Marinomonas ostreistagni TaxID=359209 RepID=UPI0019520AF3|nr:cytochrome c peroxidase [Marinomonas ostreistagni]MBM6549954.1 methylamine utilization protein MauG [Marinomonas ostreistagni]
MKRTVSSFSLIAVLALAGCSQGPQELAIESSSADRKQDLPVALDHPKAQLGSQLFFDVNLSKHRNQSCASCHDIGRAFTDGRQAVDLGAVSLGSDDHSHGERNTPTASYAALTPAFHKMANGEYRGGQFLDGRAANLAEQAGGPFVNPVEMQMDSEAAVVSRVLENPAYQAMFEKLYGEDIWEQKDKAFNAVTDAIAHFEQTELFMPFDSKYDRVMRGEDTFTPEEELGRTLFFSQQFTNCNSCHQLNSSPFAERETFTNYEYRNIGVPANPELALATQDEGLFDNPLVEDPAQRGKFKVPTLRNVAVTGPYMHNGVFKDLRTVVLFYDQYNNPMRKINPETGEPWAPAEVPENIDLETLEIGPPLENRRVDAIVAFLKTLTDKRYEPLLDAQQN